MFVCLPTCVLVHTNKVIILSSFLLLASMGAARDGLCMYEPDDGEYHYLIAHDCGGTFVRAPAFSASEKLAR